MVIFHVGTFRVGIFHLVIFHVGNFHVAFDIDIKNCYIERKPCKTVYIIYLCKLIFDIRNYFFYIEENREKSFDIEFLILYIEAIALCKPFM